MRLKPKVKKAISTPAKRQSKSIIAQRELAARLAQCKDEELVDQLKSFTQWTFGEGDIHNWVDVLNRFDEFLSKLADHYEPQTTLDLPILKSSFPRETVLHVLRVTSLILENSFNRYLYGSAEHLGDLLRIDDPEIVLATLTLLSILVKKTRSRVTTRIHGDPILNAQLFYLTKGWGGKQDGLGLLYCVQDRDITPKLSVGTTLQFEFFVDPNESKKPLPAAGASDSKKEDAMEVESVVTKTEDGSAQEAAVSKEGEEASAGEKATQAGHRSIQFPCFHLFTESNIDILTQLVAKYSIPRKYHFPLLMRIRLARAFPDVQARRDLVRTNLLAFTVLAQAHMDLGTLSSFFLYEPEFIAELMELVKSDRHTPQDFRILALDALSALTTDRSRLPKVISATGSSQHHGELPSMVRKSVATLTGSVEHPIYTLPFIDSLFSFLAALMATPDGIAALNTAGIISTLLPLLRHQNLEHAGILMQCLSILEYYVAGSNSAAAVSLFRDLGGLDLLIERFNTEIASVQKAKEQEGANMSVEGVSEAIDAKDKGKERVDTEPPAADELQPTLDEEDEEESHLSHHQRTLVKTILRILLPFIQGGGRRNIGRLTGVIEGPFPRALCYVLEHYHYFGERVFSLAVSIMSGLINNDPTRFNALAEAGLPRAFLTFVTQGVEPSSSVICALPSAISSLCLNPAGMASVVDANVIGALLSLFTTPKYRKVIKSGDTASRLGAGVDELLRHHPSLRPLGIKAMINALKRVCRMGGLALPEEAEDVREDDEDKDDEAKAEPTGANVPAENASTPMAVEESGDRTAESAVGEVTQSVVAVGTPQEMVATSASTSQSTESMELSSENVASVKEEPVEEEPEQKVPPFVEPEVELELDSSLLSDYIGNLGRFLETIFSNSEHGRNFIDAHGMELMLKLQSLPELPPTFPGSNAAHSLTLAFRSLAAHHTPTLFRGVLENMATKFDILDNLQPSWRDGSSFLEAEDNAKLVGVLASIDCFAGLLAGLVRDPSGLSRPGTTSLGEWITDAGARVSSSLGHLQRCILWEIACEAQVERKKAGDQAAAASPEETPMTEAQPLSGDSSGNSESSSSSTGAPPQQPAESPAGEVETTDVATTTSGDEKKPDKKETKQLLIHLVSSIHSVSQGLAKALGARHRNRDEKVVHALAQTLVRTLQEHLTWTPKAYTDDEGEAPIKCAYLTSVVGELRSFFFNERHNNTHTLLLHQFNYVDGVATFLKTLNWVVDVYVHLREKELEQQRSAKEGESTEKDKGKEKLGEAAKKSTAEEAPAPGDITLGSIVNEQPSAPEAETTNRDPDMEMAESALLTFGTVLKYLVCGPMVATSPITANMMTQTLPGQQGSFDPHIFLGAIQSRVLLSVMPIWNHPLFAHFPQRFITSLIHANRYIMEGEAAAAAASAASAKPRAPTKAKKQFEPDPGVVTQLMEMGFSQRRAEDALRHIGANNVELAMDWIFTNPEPEPEPTPAVMPPAAPAPGEVSTAAQAPADGMAEAMSEDEELAAALAMSLGQSIEMPSSPAAASSSSAPPPAPAKEEPAAAVVPEPKPAEEAPKKDEPVDYSKQYDILRRGMLERCVRLLTEVDNLTFTVVDVLSSICKKPDEKTAALTGAATKVDERVHVVEALADQIKLAAAERPPSKALYRLTHALTLLMIENTSIRELVATSDLVVVFLDLLELMSADAEISKLTSTERDLGPDWLTTVLLALDTLCQLPSQLPASLATADSSASKSSVGGEPMAAEFAGADAGAKDEPSATTKEDDTVLPPMEVPYLLSLPDRKRAMEACVGLLQRPLHPDPLQALLQLSSHLTRDFELAQQFIHQGGLTALLSLAPTSSFSGQVSLITTILRHLIEEPSLLQHAMESEIKSTITKLMGRSGALVKPKNFLSTVAPLVCRDPVTFLRASANVCRLRDPKPSVSPARVVLCLANPAPPAKGKGSLQASSGTGAKKTDLLAGSGKAKAKRTTPSTSVQVITELTNALLTLSRIKKAVDIKPTTKPEESEKGKEKSDANLGQESTNAMDATPTTEAESSLMDVPKRPTLSSGEILQILTDFITTYPPCGSVLLRQQLKKTGTKGKGKEKKDKKALSTSKRQMPETNSIITYVLSELLPHSPDANARTPVSPDRQKANAAAANMLAALAQKPEGRRRVIDEITQAMRKVIADRDQYTNYPEVIQALVDFLYLLLTSSASRTHASGFLGEVARLMLDVDTIKTLSAALNSADLNHPDAPQLVNSILKPLEILTRLTAVMSAKSSAAEKSAVGEASADAAQTSASSSSSSSAPEPTPAEGAAGPAGEPHQASEEGDRPQLDTSTEQQEQNDAPRAGDMEEEEETRSGEGFLESHATNLSEAIQALSGQGEQLSNVVNMTLNFINEAIQAQAHSASDMDEDLSDSSSDSESESDLSDEEREEGGAALHHHPEEEDEEEEGEEGVEEEDEDSSSAEEDEEEGGEDAYSYEEPENQQDWGGQGDFDFSIQIGNQAATTGRQWALNVEDLLLTGAPLRDVNLPRAVPPPNPFLAESVESAHPLLGARAGAPGGGLPGGDMGVDASFYPLPPSLRGNPVVEDEVRRLFGRVRAQRAGRPGQFGEEGHRTMPGMAEYAASIEPLFVETIRRVTLQELKEKEDAERAEQEKAERERAEKDEGASKGAEEKADEEPAAALPTEVPAPAATEPTEPTATVPPTTEDIAQTAPVPVEAVPADAAEPMQTSETTTAPAEGEAHPASVQPTTELTAPASEAAAVPAVSSTEPVQQSTEPSETAPVAAEGAPTPQAEQTTTPPAEVGDDLGIDPAFLAALPEDLRAEILAEQLHARSVAAASRPPQPAAPTTPAAIATPSAPATPAPAPASSSSSSSSSLSSSSAPTTIGTPGAEPSVPAVSTTSISPDFIAALPPEIQAEVLQQEQQSQAAAAAAAADLNRAQAMTTADFFATLSPDLREEILLTQDEASLPPELAAEASALRERALRQYQQYSNRRRDDGGGGWGGPGFGGPRRVPVAPAEPAAALGLASRVKAIKGGDIQPLELEGRPIIEPSELVHLVRLLYLAKPLAKGLLHRLFLNLSTHKESRMQLLNIMMTILDAFATSTQSSSVASTCLTRRFASFAEALEALPAVTPSSSFSPLEEPCHPLLSAGTMNTYAHSGQHPPSLVARRVLEILCHLLKHNPRIASFVLGSNDDIEESSAVVEAKGKEKETDLSTTTTSSSSSSSSTSPTKWCPLARLMDLLGVDQFRNSSAQLDQLLQLLALSVQPLAKLKAREERRKREIEEREARERAEQERRERERLRLELEAAEQAMTEEAALAAATAASTEDMQAAAAASAAPARTEEGQQQDVSAPATMEVEASTAPTPAEAAQETVAPAAPAQTEEQPAVADTLAEAGMEVDTPATTGSRTPAAEEEKKEEKEPRERTAEEVCPQVPVEDLRNLVSILTLENCSEGTYKNATHVLQQLSANALNREVLFKELISAAEGLAEVVVNGLDGLCEELASSFHPTLILSMASSIAELNLLRIIKTVMALPATPAQTTDDFIDSLRLEPLWDALERCLDIITESMEKDAAIKGKSKAGDAKGKERDTAGDAERDANKSPAANLLLPIIEVFFVVNAKDPGPLKRSASVIDFGGAPAVPGVPRSGSSTSLLRASVSRENLTRSMSRSGSLYNLSEQQSRFAMFAEKHRGLLNDLVRQNPALLHGTFKVLLKYPRVLDFDNKRAWFRHQLQKLKDTRGYYGGVRLRINRAKVFEDSYRIMSGRTPEELRGRMTVQFQGEEGIDAGGLTREWYDILAKEVFNADYALFINTAQDNSTFQPNRFSYYNPNHLDYFKFVGRVIGKAILDGYFLPCHFTRSFYKHILGITVQPSDMEAIDPEYYKNLRWILENDPTPLDLTFSSEVDEFGKMRVVDLKEDGKNIAVTNENKHEYVQLVTEMRMTTSIKSQIDAFLGGFHDLIPQDLISVFNEMELELLISGLPEIDLDDLRANTLYTGFSESSPAIQWFWKIVNSFGQEERAKLLQFVTGTSRVPLDGFKSLRGISGPQKFQIHKSYRKDQLPAAHTCFNQLDLPEYDNYERLREALMYAIRETEGFGFG